jgi:hypothetical protein
MRIHPDLTPYGNLSGNSGVIAFGIKEDSIRVLFHHSDEVYVYDGDKPGLRHVEQMKKRARSGKGLSAYISQHVRDNYSNRITNHE